MNIFAVDHDPYVCAATLDDKRVVKMVMETAQLLSNALPAEDRPYRPTHLNHPCSIWVSSNQLHFDWALTLFKALSDEYTKRYGKYHQYLNDLGLFRKFSECEVKWLPEETFTKCVPERFQHLPTFQAYKETLAAKWAADKRTPTWYREPRRNNNSGVNL